MKTQEKKVEIKLRLPGILYQRILKDLKRPHSFAYERVGFLYANTIVLQDETKIITFKEYEPVEDEHYIEDHSVGARIDANAIRHSMQKIYDDNCGGFHVHFHDHKGEPSMSPDDKEGLPGIIESFANVNRKQAHGILILSENSFYALVRVNGVLQFIVPEVIVAVKYPLTLNFSLQNTIATSKALDRQSFLGQHSTKVFENIAVGVVGLGGGGSHLIQQLTHLGVKRFTLFDFDRIEESNLNRLIGAYFTDVAAVTLKTEIAKRLILSICPDADVKIVNARWQDDAEALQLCDVVLGCVDTFEDRSQLEAECRRYLIPYIDIGMDVNHTEEGSQISGQVILSMPGQACMRCMGFLTEEKLAMEAAKYGNVGGRPQVVWPNGLLASSAIGVFTDLVTGWSGLNDRVVYIAYDGNTGLLSNHIRLRFMETGCIHYSLLDSGKPVFKKL